MSKLSERINSINYQIEMNEQEIEKLLAGPEKVVFLGMAFTKKESIEDKQKEIYDLRQELYILTPLVD